MNNSAGSMSQKALNGALVVSLSQIFKVLLQFASVVVLSRLLTPSDFGLAASVAPFLAFISLFQEFGFQQAVVQRDEINADLLNRIFWTSGLIGLCCFGMVLIVGPLVIWFYQDDRLFPFFVLSGLALIVTSLSALPTSLLNRQMRLVDLSLIEVASSGLAFIVVLGAALRGWGYFSLALSAPVVAVISLWAALWRSRWRPSWVSFGIERDVLRFGANLTGYNLVNFLYRNVSNVIIGRVWGATDLGYYDRAYKLIVFPLLSVNAPLSRVIIPILSRIHNDKERLRDTYLKVAGLLTLITVPGISAVVAVSEDVVRFLFGDSWLPVADIFAWLGIAGILEPLLTSVTWLFIAQARTDLLFRWGMVASTLTVAGFCVGAVWGVTGVALAFAVSGYVIRFPSLLYMAQKCGPLKAIDLLWVQVPHLLVFGIVWVSMNVALPHIHEVHGLKAIVMSVAISYCLSVVVMALNDRGRRVLSYAFDVIAKKFTRSAKPA